MRRLDCSVPSASSVEVGEVPGLSGGVLRPGGAGPVAGRTRQGSQGVFSPRQHTLFSRVKDETQLILVLILLLCSGHVTLLQSSS